MQQQIKQSKIKPIHTELNYFYLMNKQIKRIKKVVNISRLLILALIIWNICITVLICDIPKQITKDAAVIPVSMLQEISFEELED